MRLLTSLLLVGMAVGHTCAQSTPPVDSNVVLKVSIANDRREFRIGETIPLQLSFSSTVKDRYQVNMAQYDRSGRMEYEHFTVSPAQGAVDPLVTYNSVGGGLTSFQFLSSAPWTIKLNLNGMGALHSARRVSAHYFQKRGWSARSIESIGNFASDSTFKCAHAEDRRGRSSLAKANL